MLEIYKIATCSSIPIIISVVFTVPRDFQMGKKNIKIIFWQMLHLFERPAPRSRSALKTALAPFPFSYIANVGDNSAL
jgi:hypothetical protein